MSSQRTSFKRIEFAFDRIDRESIQIHLRCLQQHKANIEKYRDSQSWKNVHREQVAASQTVKKLKSDLQALEKLKQEIVDSDAEVFERKLSPIKISVLSAIEQFLDMNQRVVSPASFLDSTEEVFTSTTSNSSENTNLQLQIECNNSSSTFKSWEILRKDLHDLHATMCTLASMLMGQGKTVTRIEDNIDMAQENVAEGAQQLAKASALKATFVPLTGAIIGTCLLGPVGLMAGFKLGGIVAATAGGLVGYKSGKFVQKRAFPSDDLPMLHSNEKLKQE